MNDIFAFLESKRAAGENLSNYELEIRACCEHSKTPGKVINSETKQKLFLQRFVNIDNGVIKNFMYINDFIYRQPVNKSKFRIREKHQASPFNLNDSNATHAFEFKETIFTVPITLTVNNTQGYTFVLCLSKETIGTEKDVKPLFKEEDFEQRLKVTFTRPQLIEGMAIETQVSYYWNESKKFTIELEQEFTNLNAILDFKQITPIFLQNLCFMLISENT